MAKLPDGHSVHGEDVEGPAQVETPPRDERWWFTFVDGGGDGGTAMSTLSTLLEEFAKSSHPEDCGALGKALFRGLLLTAIQSRDFELVTDGVASCLRDSVMNLESVLDMTGCHAPTEDPIGPNDNWYLCYSVFRERSELLRLKASVMLSFGSLVNSKREVLGATVCRMYDPSAEGETVGALKEDVEKRFNRFSDETELVEVVQSVIDDTFVGVETDDGSAAGTPPLPGGCGNTEVTRLCPSSPSSQ